MAWRSSLSVLSPALLIASAFNANYASVAARIPDVHGRSLTNESVTLPDALQGHVGVLVVGFSRSSSDGIADWGRRLAANYRDSKLVVYYEMPVLASVPGVLRGMVMHSMKSSVPVRAQARFVPITEHEAAWRSLVHYGNPDDPYLLVIDGQGDVVWQTQGLATDAAYSALKQHVDALQAK